MTKPKRSDGAAPLMQQDQAGPSELVGALQDLLWATEKECASLRAENEALHSLGRVQAERIALLERGQREMARLLPKAVDRVHSAWGAAVNSLAPGMFELGQKLEGSTRARKAATSKNEAPRAWVLEQWASRPDKQQGKAAFARQHVPLVKKNFGLIVTVDTVARDWLPKAKE